jgi:Fe-S oxidoreductase
MQPKELATILEQKLTRPSIYHLDVCTRCNACTERCHMYVETRDPIHSPAYKLALLRRVHKRYYTMAGKIAPKLFKAMELNEENLKEISSAMFECTGCRRCTAHCPFGIDPPWPVSTGRFLSFKADKSPEMLSMLSNMAVEKAKNISQYSDIYLQQIKELEVQLQKETKNPNAKIPVKNKAELVYIPMAGAHTIMPAAKIFNAAGQNWSLSQFDSTNYNYFLGNIEAAKEVTGEIIKEAENLEVKTAVISECGHGFRIMRHLATKWFNRTLPFEVKSIAEIMAQYIEENAVKLDPSRNPGTVTYHDPCQLGRNGGIYEEPRTILNKVVNDFRELTPNREYNWCCGGGGGLVAIPEFKELRMKTGMKKVEQIRETKANIITSMCENCRLQLIDLNDYYKLGLEVTSLSDLMANAIIQSHS